jgi:hypothetical protein
MKIKKIRKMIEDKKIHQYRIRCCWIRFGDFETITNQDIIK